jgi:hypothetical protein
MQKDFHWDFPAAGTLPVFGMVSVLHEQHRWGHEGSRMDGRVLSMDQSRSCHVQSKLTCNRKWTNSTNMDRETSLFLERSAEVEQTEAAAWRSVVLRQCTS